MKKVALVFLLAVIVPSLVLGWLATRSLRDQQYALERQRSLLYQSAADGLAKDAQSLLVDREREFVAQVQRLLANQTARGLALAFDETLRTNWPLAQVGCAVTVDGEILSPSPQSGPEARTFLTGNAKFLVNRESAEVYWNYAKNDSPYANSAQALAQNSSFSKSNPLGLEENPDAINNTSLKKSGKAPQIRNVVPQQQAMVFPGKEPFDFSPQQYSKLSCTDAEFRQLIGDRSEGTLARFLDNKLNVLCWYHSNRDTNLIFVTQLALPALKEQLKQVLDSLEPALRDDIAVAILDDSTRPIAVSRPGFVANWKHPVVSTEIGESLPHWELAVYVLDPGRITRSVCMLNLTLGLLIGVLLLSIVMGSWLIVKDFNRQLTLARQKTDFVSNVSHELKTPLTSIRMFSELLAEGRVSDPEKRKSYLEIITAESSRLTRLINNVLDFAHLERGEKRYEMRQLDLVALIRETAETYRPQLEKAGFKFQCELPGREVVVNADRDALAQIIVNLLSNAEKYSGTQREISMRIEVRESPLPHAELQVLDRGLGVPAGSEEKIFEKFYRAHDSLSSGIQGSGLGLTLARQIARAHGGEVVYEPRQSGGSCFMLRLPLVGSKT